MRWCLVVVVCAACGDVQDKADARPLDDAPVVDTMPMTDAPGLGTFNAAQRVDEVSTPTSSEDDPSITADGLELYFASDRPGAQTAGDHIWVAKRTSASAPWGTPVLAPGLGTNTSQEGTGEVSGDGLTFWMISNRSGSTFDLYVSTRANRTQPWGTPQLATELNTTSDERSPRVTEDGLVMYLISDRAGGTTASDIYRATRTIGAPWGVPDRVAELSTSMIENRAAPALGESIVIYISAGDLYEVTRQGETFGTPRPMTELNNASDDQDVDLSPDGRTLYFSRDSDIYVATR